jgi:pimeloyl-ACP methyl ester carboxylesterase
MRRSLLRIYGLVFVLIFSSLAIGQVQSTLQATLFYEDSNASFRAFNQPVVDKNGNVIVFGTQFGFSCPFNVCGVVVYSIAPNGTLNWRKPDTGFAANAVNQVALGLDNTIYFQDFFSTSRVFAYDPNGNPVPNWPVVADFALDTGARNLLVDPLDGSILVKSGTSFSFSTFPGQIKAYHPDGSEKWRADFPQMGNNTPGMVIGPNDDIYTTADQGVILRGTDGTFVCDIGPFAPLVGGAGGVFTPAGTSILRINPDCSLTTVFTSSTGQVSVFDYDNGIVFGGELNALIGLLADGTVWRNTDFNLIQFPIIKNSTLYGIGIDVVDQKEKLFLVDENSGKTLNAFDTTGVCGSCGVAVDANGTVYINDLGPTKIYKISTPANVTDTGTLNVLSNRTAASFHAIGPISVSGTGLSASFNLPTGTYTVTFDSLPGLVTPSPQLILVSAKQTTNVTGFYLIPQPTITDPPAPNIGTRAQDIPVVVISGQNFLPTATVAFSGNVKVNSIQFVSPTELRVSLNIPRDAALGVQSMTIDNGCLRECAGPPAVLPNAFEVKRRPVIVIPGIMGSFLQNAQGDVVWLNADNLKNVNCDEFLFPLALDTNGIDPALFIGRQCFGLVISGRGEALVPTGIFDSGANTDFYGSLLSSLKDYSPVTFAYDWRLDFRTPAIHLRAIIEKLAPNPWDHVDIVAHSQGGLVTRTYLGMISAGTLGQSSQDGRIDTVIYLGTPHRGSPKSFAILSGWQDYEKFFGPFVHKHFDYNTLVDISQNFTAAYELLPRDPFFFQDSVAVSADDTVVSSLPNTQIIIRERDLWSTLLSTFPSIPRSVAINGSGKLTFTGFETHSGLPCKDVDAQTTGDGTVPNASASFLPIPNLYVNESHSDIPNSKTVDQIVPKILDGVDPESLVLDPQYSGQLRVTPFGDKSHYIAGHTCSPVTMQVTDSAGALTGFEVDGHLLTDIPNSDFLRFPENEAVILDASDTYSVNLHATANGTFSLVFELRDSQTVLATARFDDIPITDQARATVSIDSVVSPSILQVDVDGDGIPDFSVSANTPASARSYVQTLLAIVAKLGIPADKSQDLIEILNNTEVSIDRGRTTDARQRLLAFIQKVTAQTGKTLSSDQASLLTRLAQLAVARLQS